MRDQDDIVQEAYSRLIQERRKGPIRSAKSFIFTVARNLSLDFFRRKSVISMEEITDFSALSVSEDRPRAEEIFNRAQELKLLREAVESLPERCRQVILLRFYDGLSYKEIAARMEISPETVKVQMMKGVRRCTEHFRDKGILRPDTGAEQ